ncbi:MAG: flagellar basal body-associated FliL family protein [Pseudomonadota bacterium]
MAKLLPVLLAVVGTAGGGAAGFFLRPDPSAISNDSSVHPDCPPPAATATAAATQVTQGASAFVKFDNQFVVPVTSSDAVVSLVVLSLTLEVSEGAQDAVFARMPKLRDAFLGVLFDHSSAGGFSAEFVNGRGLDTLRGLLKETAVGTAGSEVMDVLIVDLVKQDV